MGQSATDIARREAAGNRDDRERYAGEQGRVCSSPTRCVDQTFEQYENCCPEFIYYFELKGLVKFKAINTFTK